MTNSCVLDRKEKPEWITTGLITLRRVYAQHKCLLSFRPPTCTELLMQRGFEVAHHPVNLVTYKNNMKFKCVSASSTNSTTPGLHRRVRSGRAGSAAASENIKTIKTDPEPIRISTGYLKWTVDGSFFGVSSVFFFKNIIWRIIKCWIIISQTAF